MCMYLFVQKWVYVRKRDLTEKQVDGFKGKINQIKQCRTYNGITKQVFINAYIQTETEMKNEKKSGETKG